jgi:NAD+-dependent protein deacetylase sirtuin 5
MASYICTCSFRTHRALQAHPNKAHTLLAKLSVPKYLKVVALAAKLFHLVTQNVDGTSTAALKSLDVQQLNIKARLDRAQMDPVIETHGSLFDVKCTKRGHTVQDFSNPLCPSLGAADLLFDDYVDAGSKKMKQIFHDVHSVAHFHSPDSESSGLTRSHVNRCNQRFNLQR